MLNHLPITLCDSVGARTQDLLLRRQLLYPAELPNHPFLMPLLEIGCKGRQFFAYTQIFGLKSAIISYYQGVYDFLSSILLAANRS